MLLVADYNEKKEGLAVFINSMSGINVTYDSYTLVDSGYHSIQCSDISIAVRVGSCITTTASMHT